MSSKFIVLPSLGLCVELRFEEKFSLLQLKPTSPSAEPSAEGAEYESQGQARSASPLVSDNQTIPALKGRNLAGVISAFQASNVCGPGNQGRRAPLRFALAPGFHIPRRWRSELVPLYYSSPGDQYYLGHSNPVKMSLTKREPLLMRRSFRSCYLSYVDPTACSFTIPLKC